MQTKEVKISRPPKEKAYPPPSYLFLVQWPLMEISLGTYSVTCTGLSNRWSREAVYCQLPSIFYLTDCTSDASRSSDICELMGSSRQFADVCKIFCVKVALYGAQLSPIIRKHRVQLRGISSCRTMSACLQVFTYPSRRPSPPHHTEAVQTCHTYNYQTHHLYLLSVFGSMFTCGIMLFRLCSFNQLITCLAVFLINRDHRQHNKEQRSFFLKKAL